MRRDRLNNLVATLAEEVPFVANSHRRLDKTAILRLTVSYMKLHHGKVLLLLLLCCCFTFTVNIQGHVH